MKLHIAIAALLALALHSTVFAQEGTATYPPEGSYQHQLAEQKARMELEKLQAEEAAQKKAAADEAKKKEDAEKKAAADERKRKQECEDRCREQVRRDWGQHVSEKEYRQRCQKCGNW